MNTSHSDFIVQIQKKRLTLERLITIACDIERMNKGLSVLVNMQEISTEFSEDTLLLLTHISKNITDYSTSNVTEVLKSFDHRVRKSLDKVMDLALIELSRDMEKEAIETTSKKLNNIVEQFKKDVHTALGIRLLLKERSANTPDFKCTVPINTIRERIDLLEKKEDMFRYTIDIKIDSIMDDVTLFLKDERLPSQIRDEVIKVRDDLYQKKEHLQSGKEFSDNPMILEHIEISIEDIPHDPEENEMVYEATQDKNTKPHNLLKRISIWIKTPLETNWKDTKYYTKNN